MAGPNGRREVAVEEFCTAPGRTVLQAGELLVSIDVPAPPPGFGAAYLRFIPRNEMDIAVVGRRRIRRAGREPQNHSVRTHLAGRSCAHAALREGGGRCAGRASLPATRAIERAALIAQDAARPITDMRGTAEYRKHLSAVLTRRALKKRHRAGRRPLDRLHVTCTRMGES